MRILGNPDWVSGAIVGYVVGGAMILWVLDGLV